MRGRFQPFHAIKESAENFGREENLSLVLIPTTSKDMDEQLKLTHKLVDAVDRANRKICATMLHYSVDKPESSYAQVRMIAGKNEVEKFHQIVCENYEFKKPMYFLIY